MEDKQVTRRQVHMEVELVNPTLESLSEFLSVVRKISGVNEAIIIPSLENKAAVSFESELEALINRRCLENGSGTPDFILARYLQRCLETWDKTTRERDQWRGFEPDAMSRGTIIDPYTTD